MNDLGNPTLSGGLLFIELGLLPKLARSSGARSLKFKVLNLWNTEKPRMLMGFFYSPLCPLLLDSLGLGPDVPELSEDPLSSS